jgi:hypothetical protein
MAYFQSFVHGPVPVRLRSIYGPFTVRFRFVFGASSKAGIGPVYVRGGSFGTLGAVFALFVLEPYFRPRRSDSSGLTVRLDLNRAEGSVEI